MISKAARAGTVAALMLASLASGGCASLMANQKPDRTPSWMKHYVAGSRIPRRVDHEGQPDTGTYVISISDKQLKGLPGLTLSEKLSGVPSTGW